MSGPGVPELFDIDFFEGGIYVVGNLQGNGTERFVVRWNVKYFKECR